MPWLTALKVCTTSIAFWAAISAPVDGPQGDYDQAKLKEYAEKGQAAGKAWALAIQAHSHNTCSWQYVHDTFAHVSCRPPRVPSPSQPRRFRPTDAHPRGALSGSSTRTSCCTAT